MKTKKWYCVELTEKSAEKFSNLCKEMKLEHEASEAGKSTHFEVKLVPNSTEYHAINLFLSAL